MTSSPVPIPPPLSDGNTSLPRSPRSIDLEHDGHSASKHNAGPSNCHPQQWQLDRTCADQPSLPEQLESPPPKAAALALALEKLREQLRNAVRLNEDATEEIERLRSALDESEKRRGETNTELRSALNRIDFLAHKCAQLEQSSRSERIRTVQHTLRATPATKLCSQICDHGRVRREREE